MKKVLIFPSGTEIGLEIFNSLRWSKDFKLYGTSSQEPNHSQYIFQNYIGLLPFVKDINFIPKLKSIIHKYNIDYIYPAHDDVLLKLVQERPKIGTAVIAPDLKTCQICRSKHQTYSYFRNKISVPKVFTPRDKLKYPVFLKPDQSQGARGTHIVYSKEELNFYLKQDKTLLILEYLPGNEYTIDCFTKHTGELLFIGPRERVRVDRGISINSRLVKSSKIVGIAEFINQHLKLHGAWFFQLKKNKNDEYVLLEIAPRIAGTMSLYRHIGINFPLLTLYDLMKNDVKIINNNFTIEIDRALYPVFKTNIRYQNIYIDWDDCLFLNKKLNTQLMTLIFKCKNENKNIFLLSRSRTNPKPIMHKLLILPLFKKIYHLKKSELKSTFIKSKDSIFIDDSFAERYEVHKKLNIPVFDLDAINLLL